MNSVINVSWLQLITFSLLLCIPLLISRWLELRLGRDILISVGRMAIQLAAVGVYLEYLFSLNSLLINILWLGAMMLIGACSILSKARLAYFPMLIPVCCGLFIGLVPMLMILCLLVIKPVPFYTTQYMIPLAGMLLGNTLSSNIIALQNLFTAYAERESEYQAAISLGASPIYASRQFVQEAIQKATAPLLASMATIGLVTLPGMMTGQILGGNSPLIAIKYQFMIMVAIFIVSNVALITTMQVTLRLALDKSGRICVSVHKK